MAPTASMTELMGTEFGAGWGSLWLMHVPHRMNFQQRKVNENSNPPTSTTCISLDLCLWPLGMPYWAGTWYRGLQVGWHKFATRIRTCAEFQFKIPTKSERMRGFLSQICDNQPANLCTRGGRTGLVLKLWY